MKRDSHDHCLLIFITYISTSLHRVFFHRLWDYELCDQQQANDQSATHPLVTFALRQFLGSCVDREKLSRYPEQPGHLRIPGSGGFRLSRRRRGRIRVLFSGRRLSQRAGRDRGPCGGQTFLSVKRGWRRSSCRFLCW